MQYFDIIKLKNFIESEKTFNRNFFTLYGMWSTRLRIRWLKVRFKLSRCIILAAINRIFIYLSRKGTILRTVSEFLTNCFNILCTKFAAPRYYIFVFFLNINPFPLTFLSYKSVHFLFFTGSGGSKAAKIASSNTFFKPFWNF